MIENAMTAKTPALRSHRSMFLRCLALLFSSAVLAAPNDGHLAATMSSKVTPPSGNLAMHAKAPASTSSMMTMTGIDSKQPAGSSMMTPRASTMMMMTSDIPTTSIPSRPPTRTASSSPTSACAISTYFANLKEFVVPIASLVYTPDASSTFVGTPSLPGTIFIWNKQSIYKNDGVTVVPALTVTGSCLRTTADNGGAGGCVFVFVHDICGTINAEGVLEEVSADLAVTGGTRSWAGAEGEFNFIPIISQPDGDVFTDATQYEVSVKLL